MKQIKTKTPKTKRKKKKKKGKQGTKMEEPMSKKTNEPPKRS